MAFNKFLFMLFALAAFLSGLCYWLGKGDVFAFRGTFCLLVSWCALLSEKIDADRERLDDLEDAHSRRWEP
jgi:hypothetical protein